MGIYIALISLIVFSGGGMSYFFWNRFRDVRTMEEGELLLKLRESKSSFVDFHTFVVVPSIDYWKNSILPNIYKEFEKIVSRFRINVLKVECWLLKLTNYIRGKRAQNNENCDQSQYWKEVNDFKNDLNGNGDKKPE